MEQRIKKCCEQIRKLTDFVPEIALVLGSGLGGIADKIEVCAEVPYSAIEGFPVSTVLGHEGKFVFGYIKGVPVAAMQGRVHHYEGYTTPETVMPIRILHLMGADKCIITNASGGIGKHLQPGDFMIIKDHISLFVPSPLIGKNIESLGTRFPDMSKAYDEEYIETVKKMAEKNEITVKEGVYVQLTGPSFESPAEIRMLGALGADAVGMSTVCEVIAARHMGMRVCAVSCVANLAAGITKNPLTHKEVIETGAKVAPLFEKLIIESVPEIAKL